MALGLSRHPLQRKRSSRLNLYSTAAKVGRFIETEQTNRYFEALKTPSCGSHHGNKRRQSLIVGNLDPNSQGAHQYFLNSKIILRFFMLARPFDILREAQEALRDTIS